MLLLDKETGSIIEINDLVALINPLNNSILAQDQAGQEEQDPEEFEKKNLAFPSGESLPRYWLDENYRNA
ncbi:MAG: acetyltransferase [Scytonematopsis contorta HA4267-MV1]|jgi:hypothetical protein|nr:acetyltransferase [Scytonematopsis contorta HA4267-MV1]